MSVRLLSSFAGGVTDPPRDLELDLLLTGAAFVLDTEPRRHRDANALTRDLKPHPAARIERIGELSQSSDKLPR